MTSKIGELNAQDAIKYLIDLTFSIRRGKHLTLLFASQKDLILSFFGEYIPHKANKFCKLN